MSIGHSRYTSATWKQGFNSEMHCLAGDATGIIVAASIVPVLGLANGWDLVLEYSAGFISGLFIFQALMMVGMYAGNYFMAVRKTFFAETVSMNFVMTGMIPSMVLLSASWPDSDSPMNPEFWFRMSLASIVGGLIAFPVNYWLVKNHLKHGCMTLPGADGPAPGLGHLSPEPASDQPMGTMENMEGMKQHESMSQNTAAPTQKHGMEMRSLSLPTMLLWITGTYVLLFAAIWLTARWVSIMFS